MEKKCEWKEECMSLSPAFNGLYTLFATIRSDAEAHLLLVSVEVCAASVER